jgi:hypothetical protein
MRILKHSFTFLILALIFSACTENIEYGVGDQEPVIVVDGLFTAVKKAHEVKLTWSSGVYNTDAPKPVEGATVAISSANDIIALTEVTPGVYSTADSIMGEIGIAYSLNISYEGESFNSDEIVLVDVPEIDCAFMIDGDTSSVFTRGKYLALMAANETPGVGNYYLWNFYANDTLFTDTIGEKIYNSDELIDGIEFTQIPIFFFDSLEINKYDDLRLEMMSINKDYYEFLIAMQLESFRGSPFDGPAANVPTNMSNGALGFFLVSDVSVGNVCKLVEPFDQLEICDFSCLGTMCQLGVFSCEQCELLGVDC